MKVPTPLTHEQEKFRSVLTLAVEHINEADDLLTKNTSDLASNRATALLLLALGRVLLLETAEKHSMSNQLPAFTHLPKI